MASEKTEPCKLMLIDGHSMAFRAFYALPTENFSTKSGQHTNAVYGFVSMLINLLRDEQPTHIGVAFDLAGPTFRAEIYPEYKATRKATPQEFIGQIELIQQVLDALNIRWVNEVGNEGDDIIATLATEASGKGWQSVIVSGDRDSFQLIDERTTVLFPRRGVSDLSRMTPESLEEKYQVPPSRYPELAALVGETSDNLPGVPKVGPKTAAKWLAAYDGLDNLLASADTVAGKVGESLRSHIDEVMRNRRLNALVKDLSLPIGVGDLERENYDPKALDAVFNSLEFGAMLRERLMNILGSQNTSFESIELDQEILTKNGELSDWLAENSNQLIGIDVNGRWGNSDLDISAISLATSNGQAVWFDVVQLSSEDEKALAQWLADVKKPKAIHGAKRPLQAIWARGWQLGGLVCDTELAAYLLRPDQRKYELNQLALSYLGRQLKAGEETQSLQDALDIDCGDANESMLRAGAVVELAQVLDKKLDEIGQIKLLTDLEQPLAWVLAEMENTGIAVDLEVLEGLRQDFDSKVASASRAAFEAIGHELNLASPKQLQVVLFDELKLPKTKKIRSGYTTDAEALAKLYEKTSHPFLESLLAWRDAIKLLQTVDGLRSAVGADGRIHTTFQQTIAATGRLSSSDPNLQNIPIRTPEGVRIRDAFVVGAGFDGLMSADYSQIEMRVMADVSGDEALINAFNSGVDFHTMTAARVYRVPAEQVSSQMRAHVKQMNYGLAYGLSAYGLSSRIGVPVDQAKSLMKDYFATFGKVRDYLNGIVEEARKNGYTETILGRRRYLPDLVSSNRQRREMAERAALNAPIQGSAADIIKVAMLRVDKALKEAQLKSRILLQIHDELVLEVAGGEREEVAQIVTEQMAKAAQLKVELKVSIGYGHSWHEAAH